MENEIKTNKTIYQQKHEQMNKCGGIWNRICNKAISGAFGIKRYYVYVSHIVSSQVTLLDDFLNSQLDVHSILKKGKHKTRILYDNW